MYKQMIISSVQSLSHVQPFVTPWTATCQASCPSTPELAQTHVHWAGDAIHHFILCHLLLLLPSIFPSTRVFSNESILHIGWPKYWSFSFSISLFNAMSIQDWFPVGLTGLIPFQSKKLSRSFSNTTVKKHQFFSAQLSF